MSFQRISTVHCDFQSLFKVAVNENSHTDAVRNYLSSFAPSVPCVLFAATPPRLGGMSDFMWVGPCISLCSRPERLLFFISYFKKVMNLARPLTSYYSTPGAVHESLVARSSILFGKSHVQLASHMVAAAGGSTHGPPLPFAFILWSSNSLEWHTYSGQGKEQINLN